jgi:hypothetical protein
LHYAPGIRCDDRVRSAFNYAGDFVVKNISAKFLVLKVINTGPSAATFEASQRDNREPRNGSQQIERGLSDSLRVNQMARSIIRDSPLDAAFRPSDARLNQKLRNVPNLNAEIFGPICEQWVISKQVRVFLHRRPATCCINDDPICTTRKKGVYVLSCKLPRNFDLSGMGMQRATTHLSIGI